MLSLPKRIRPFLPHDPRLAGDVLRILLRAIRTALRRASPGAAPTDGDVDRYKRERLSRITVDSYREL